MCLSVVPLPHEYQGNASNPIETITSETRPSPKMNGVEESLFVVEVDKSAGSLGLTLEGGSDAGGDVKIKSVKVRLKPGLNDQTFSFNIVFDAHNMEWLNKQTVFDQTSNKTSPQNASYVLPLKFSSDVTKILYLIGCFSPLGFALFPEVAKRSNICS